MNDVDVSDAIAQQAGQMLLQLRQDAGSIDTREQADVLRKRADQASHELIAAFLAEHRPNDAVLSEEGKDNELRLAADRVWIVDPLDGTWEYGQGRADFAVHVALWIPQAAELQACTIDLPAQGVTHSMRGPTSTPSAMPTDRPLRMVASRSRPPETLNDVVRILTEMVQEAGINEHGVQILDVGSVGAKVNEIIGGRAEAYMHDTGFYEWDVAAPLGVAQHLGFDGSHVDGTAVMFNHMPPYVNNLIVSHPQLTDMLQIAIGRAART